MLLDELQKLQLHNSSFMNQYTYANHATMLQLDHYNYYAITLQPLCHYIIANVPLCYNYCAIMLQLLCNYICNNVLKQQ